MTDRTSSTEDIQDLDSSVKRLSPAKKFVLAIVAIQVFIFACVYVVVPAYLIPFLYDPACQIAMGCSVLWQVLGFCIFLTGYKTWKAIIVVLFFSMPLPITYGLGPGFLPLIHPSLGPIMGGGRD